MNDLNSSKNKYHQALTQVQEALEHYSTSIRAVFQTVQTIGDEQTEKECTRFLSIAMDEVIEIQRITAQKEFLLGFEPQQLSILHPVSRPSYSSQPTLVKNFNINPYLNPLNMAEHHFQNSKRLMPNTKYETPVKPWLSEKVYRNSYINK